MKKLILLFALLFSVSTSFISCRDTEREADDIEMSDDMEDEMEEVEEEVEEEMEEMEDDGM